MYFTMYHTYMRYAVYLFYWAADAAVDILEIVSSNYDVRLSS